MMKPHHYSRNLSSPCSFLGKTFLVGLPQQPTVLRCLVSCAWDQSFKDSVKFAYRAQHKKGTTAGINLSTALLKQFSGRWRRHTAHFGPSTGQREGCQRWQLTSMSSDLILLTAFTMVSVSLPRSEPELEKSSVSQSEKGMLCLLFHGLCTYPKSKYRSLPKGANRALGVSLYICKRTLQIPWKGKPKSKKYAPTKQNASPSKDMQLFCQHPSLHLNRFGQLQRAA